MRVGMGGARLEMDPLQLHLKVALQPGKAAAPDAAGAPAERTAIVAISELVRSFCFVWRSSGLIETTHRSSAHSSHSRSRAVHRIQPASEGYSRLWHWLRWHGGV